MSGAVTADLGDGGGVGGAIKGGHIIGASDGDNDVLSSCAALLIVDGDGEGQLCGFTICEEVDFRVGDVVGPVDGIGTIWVVGDVCEAESVQQRRCLIGRESGGAAGDGGSGDGSGG